MLNQLYKFLFVDDLLKSSANAAPSTPEPLKKKLMRDFARLTLFSYILLVFNPVMPMIADKMAHTFWLEYHLITVHGVYGSTHVDTELSNNAKQAEKDKTAGNTKAASDELFQIIATTEYKFTSAYSTGRSYPFYKTNYPVTYPSAHYQPPKV